MSRRPIQASIERAWSEIAAIEEAFASRAIDQAGWHARMAALVVPAYLAADNPRAQSGYSGNDAEWQQARSLVSDAIPRSGTFLDVGCASGLLMESVHAWCHARGLDVEPYGLDIAPELADLARRRLPLWADRVIVGNGISSIPPFRFDFVRTGLEYVPAPCRADLVAHLLCEVVAPGGRLLIGPYNVERDETRVGPSMDQRVGAWGHGIAGRIERPHRSDARVVRRLFHIDRPGA